MGSVQAEIRSLQRELEALRMAPDRSELSSTEQEIVAKLNSLLEQEEVMWRQRSRVQWLAAGDKSTRFFHLRASQRRRKNCITELVSSNGTVVTDGAALGTMATEFYTDLYSSEGVQGMHEVLDAVPVKVTANMNLMLDAPFVVEEVKNALFEIYPIKAQGLMGSLLISSSGIGSCVELRLLKWSYGFFQGRRVRKL
jgi:hypothetical protein